MKTSKVKFNELRSGMRFDSSYHLSEGTLYIKKLREMPHQELSLLTSAIFTAGRSKRVYTGERYGYPYLSNSDVVKQNPFESCKFNSKKFGYDERSFLKEGMIVTGRVGAIGQSAYITSQYEQLQAMGSDNIIRIVSKDKKQSGYIFAFLASKYGKTLLWRLAAGGVQPYISEEMLKDIPIPLFTRTKQQEIHVLISEASNLRVEANNLLSKAHKIINEELQYKRKETSKAISINVLQDTHQKRFDAGYFISEGKDFRGFIKTKDFKYLKDLCLPIFRPGIFKRNYVEKGIEFLGGADIIKSIPQSDKKLSIVKTNHLKELTIEEDWILVTCGGTIGSCVLTNSFLAGKTASQHVIRVIADKISVGFLFAYMTSQIGKKAIQSFTYGSVIPQIEPHHLELLPVPIFNNELMSRLHEQVMEYKKYISKAINNELSAISLVEKEIESWQKS